MAAGVELAGVGVELVPESGSAGGTVTTVSVVTANGVSGSVSNPTTTPAITVALGAITPSSVQTPTITTASNADLTLSPNGTGLMKYGVGTPNIAVVVAGSIPVKLANGTTVYLMYTTAQ